MVVFPNIKINIGLFVTGKRPDGYHNIESVFYPVPWYEALEVSKRLDLEGELNGAAFSQGSVRLMTYGNPIPGASEQNLCIRVYELLNEWYNLPETDIHLLKTLPIGAGLGSGSADAAFTLRALKDFYGLAISDVEAIDLLAKVGSDCPFFWKNKPAFVYGRGERLQAISLDLSGYYIILVNPGIHVSTKQAYAGVNPQPPAFDLHLLPDVPIENWHEVVNNDFESSVFNLYPEISEIKNELLELGAIYASMSGSGSTVYGIFKSEIKLPEKFDTRMSWRGWL